MMKPNRLTLFLGMILLTLLIQTTSSQSLEPQLDFLGGNCSNSENININGTYHTNINTLLSNLQSFSSINKFILESSGEGPNRVNGLFLCRPDIDGATCQRCFVGARDVTRKLCLKKKEAIVLYEECMLRYTNNSLSPSNNETKPRFLSYSNYNVTEPENFPQMVNTTMKALISKAVSPENKPKFYALHAQKKFTFFEGFYGMVLCRPDITPEHCESCLTAALGKIPRGSLAQYTMVFLPNCRLKYDTAPFVFPSHVEPSSSSSPTPALPISPPGAPS